MYKDALSEIWYQLVQISIKTYQIGLSHIQFLNYSRNSHMTCQPKVRQVMADFETLPLYISLNSSKMCIYLGKNLVTGVVPGKRFDFQP